MATYKIKFHSTTADSFFVTANSEKAAIEYATRIIKHNYKWAFEVEASEMKSTPEKSPQASLVLRLMDNDFSFQQSIKAALVAYPDCDQKGLIKELENYI